jgi:hypothetical protein
MCDTHWGQALAGINLRTFQYLHVTRLLGSWPEIRKIKTGDSMRMQFNPLTPSQAVFCFSLALTAFSFGASPASAQFYVRSPEVDKGEAEIEEHGAFYSGPGEDEHLTQTHELEGKYGITERFEVILEGVFEQSIGEDFEAEEIEIGGQYEIVQHEGDGVGFAFRALY